MVGTLVSGYYVRRLWVFSNKVTKAFDYTFAAIDCLIQENGQSENDIDVLFKGFKSRKEYYDAVNKQYTGALNKTYLERKVYNDQIPECKKFYSVYRCWELDHNNIKSVENCGKNFGLNQDEIDAIKKDPKNSDKIIDQSWKRQEKEHNSLKPKESK
jgi:hypothetical protein